MMRVRKSRGEVRDTLLWEGRKNIDCEKVSRLRSLVLPVRVRVKVKALESGLREGPRSFDFKISVYV
jgi:hypothetical protein